jgi:NAD(P)-dependent dehydrogenase (short-subunit alcohol dehydrogenase family)
MKSKTQIQRVAVVTGSGQGIGAGCARNLAAAGFKVLLMSPSDRSVELAKELGGIGIRGSVLNVRDLASLVDLAKEQYGRIDVVVNNMGHGGGLPTEVEKIVFDKSFEGPLLEIDDATWHESLDMYVLAAIRISRLVTPVMISQGAGSIVNISSMNALEPRPMYPMSVLRLALHGFTKLFADRYGRYGVRMNNLLPGFCENVPLSQSAMDSIPMARPARMDEIGRACVFLASDASSYMTGQNMLVDGGVNRGVG